MLEVILLLSLYNVRYSSLTTHLTSTYLPWTYRWLHRDVSPCHVLWASTAWSPSTAGDQPRSRRLKLVYKHHTKTSLDTSCFLCKLWLFTLRSFLPVKNVYLQNEQINRIIYPVTNNLLYQLKGITNVPAHSVISLNCLRKVHMF